MFAWLNLFFICEFPNNTLLTVTFFFLARSITSGLRLAPFESSCDSKTRTYRWMNIQESPCAM
jgi:hypothetical protein